MTASNGNSNGNGNGNGNDNDRNFNGRTRYNSIISRRSGRVELLGDADADDADNDRNKMNKNGIAKKGTAKTKTPSRFLKSFQLSLMLLVGFAIITTYSLSKYVMKQVDEESFGSGNNGEPIHLKRDHIGTTPTSNSNNDIDVVVGEGGGSACLLIKDDNSRLIEWLAYHYTMLPLRHLIVAVDPDSKTTPHSILKRWNTIGENENEKKLNYIIWDDNDYMDPFTIMKRTQAHENQLDITIDETTNLIVSNTGTDTGVLSPQNLTSLYVNIHRDRQRQFLSNCYRHHKLMNHTWVMHIDTDEYIVFNTIPGIDDASAITKNSILKSNIKIDNDEPTKDESGTKIYPKVGRITLPKLGRGLVDIDNKTILDVLAKRTKNIVSPCMGMIRLLFGDKLESIPLKDDFYSNNNNKTTVAKSIFDLNSFDTLKFNYHHQKGLYEPKPKINGIGKVIVDVSQMSYKDMDAKQLFSIHRPLLLECPSEMIGPRAYVDSLFRVNHYLGSWEAYKERNDIRRSRDVFNYRANTGTGLPSYDIRPWLEDFIKNVGKENAGHLLKGIGKPFSAASTSSTSNKRTKKNNNKSKAATAVAAAAKITTPITTEIGVWPPKRTCAILFFGIGRKFKDISYPSIKTNILDINPDCDIFVHTYDIKKAHGSREGEGGGAGGRSGDSGGSDSSIIDSEELFLLVTNGNYSSSSSSSTDNHINDQQQAISDGKIIFETEDDFERQRDYKKYRDFFPNPSAWEYPTSMDNMIRQWHSIAGVWKLMRIKETQNHHRYDRVGLFRPDVLYTHPINIMGADDENGKYEHAVIPSMMYTCTLWCGYNDRMFYGDRMYADIWSSTRFDTVDTYLQYQKNHSKIKGHYYEELSGIHSEDFLRFIFEIKYNNIIPLTIKDICFQRVRSNGLINQDDCELIQNITYPNTTKMMMMMMTTTTAKTIVAENKNTDTEKEKEIIFNIPNNAPGLIVLGMHRSGTSLLTGVLSKVFHWHVPGDHVFANITSQNPKGFFENIDIARQNDAWLEEQDMSWDELGMYTSKDNSSIVYGGLDFSKIGPLNTNGKGALIAYNNIENRPWALKDPRLCIILSKWLSLLKEEEKDSPPPPPILFTYRNPMDSARSLGARKRNPVPMLKGFKLWIWYNREAIRLSNGLCRVITSNDALLADANNEITRIENELSICGLKAVIKPHYDEVDKFINPDFQHGSDKNRDKSRNVAVDDKTLCKISPYQSPTIDASKLLQSTEKIFYHKAMHVFCDMKSGKAFLNDYIWPTIPKDNTDFEEI